MRRLLVVALSLTLLASAAEAQLRRLSLDELYDPHDKIDLVGNAQRHFVWLDDQQFLWTRTDPSGRALEEIAVDARTGQRHQVLARAAMETALRSLDGITAETAHDIAGKAGLVISPAHDAFLFEAGGRLGLFRFKEAKARFLTSEPIDGVTSFSPDGTKVAFVRDHDLYTLDLARGTEHRLTSDGIPTRLNGKLDWVYQEEIYGRGDFQGYWWSPDSSSIAYLQLDETPVVEFTIVDHIPYLLDVEEQHYPKAGTDNPAVRLLVVGAEGGESRPVDLGAWKGDEILAVNVSWTPDSRKVAFQIQDRIQTWLDLAVADAGTGETRKLLRETTPAWVDVQGSPEWLHDGTFLWFSERDGYKHLYHYRADGTLLGQITRGPWEARSFHGVDETSGWIYFSGTERSVTGVDVYRIRMDGTRLTRLSNRLGTHGAVFSPDMSWYLDRWSDINTPQKVILHRADGTTVRTVDENQVPRLQSIAVSKPELMQVKTRDGFVMEAMMIRPPDFDPAKKYPVYQYIYGGPHTQTVINAWPTGGGADRYWFHQLLAQQGVIVWIVDNRTASGKGAVSTWPVYRNFGELELRDQTDALTWLKSQPWVDGHRVMISGWSYGGFMTSYALTHSTGWMAGIAGGPVTDWRDYDTIYTERYMQTPQQNEEGYRKSSPRWAAAELSGSLLLIHGSIDDNVHMQNTMQFAFELEKSGKLFQMMLYPKSRHHVGIPALNAHLYQTMFSFVVQQLAPGH